MNTENKKWGNGVFLLFFVFLFSCAPQERKVTPDMINFPQTASDEGNQNQPQPVITFDEEIYNFGTIAIGEKVGHTFHFTNTGKAPLVISQVVPSCGCTTLKDWPQEPVFPGENGKITVEFNSTGFPGAVEKTISVSTNCIPKDRYLKLKGQVSGKESDNETAPVIQMERTR